MVKLKRFMLRYDPPGIGFEVEMDDHTITVLHQELPPSPDVTSQKDIQAAVDDLIEKEEWLTRKRHRAALIQLLGRLYKVDVDATDDEGGDSASVPSPTAAEKDGPQEGQMVVLVGLKTKMQVYNGEIATISKVKKDKFEVVINERRLGSDAEALKVKGAEHVVPVAKATQLYVGTHVAIRGLRNHVELNGCLGRVVECHEESHRFEVRATESGQLFRVKQENLVPIEMSGSQAAGMKENREPNTIVSPPKKDPQSASAGAGAAEGPAAANIAAAGDGFDEILEGSQVQLVGLKTAMCYNGQTAEVLSVDRVRCRYEIRLNDGSVKTIRAENVRLLNPSKTSPRTRRKDGSAAGAGQSSKMR